MRIRKTDPTASKIKLMSPLKLSTKSPPSNPLTIFPVDNNPVTQVRIVHPDGLKAERDFSFDNVFIANDTQEDVYEKSVRAIIRRCMEGYNGW